MLTLRLPPAARPVPRTDTRPEAGVSPRADYRVRRSDARGVGGTRVPIRFYRSAAGGTEPRPIQPFEYENRATRIENLLLFPVAPFVSPQSARIRMRGEAMQALAAHLTRALAGGAPGPAGGAR